jgi:hypothetical protein
LSELRIRKDTRNVEVAGVVGFRNSLEEPAATTRGIAEPPHWFVLALFSETTPVQAEMI